MWDGSRMTSMWHDAWGSTVHFPIDCFTDSFRSPYGRQTACRKGCARGLSVAFEKTVGIPTGRESLPCIATDTIPTDILTNQSQKGDAMSHSPIYNPTATRLGLCNSLFSVNINSGEPTIETRWIIEFIWSHSNNDDPPHTAGFVLARLGISDVCTLGIIGYLGGEVTTRGMY